MSRRKTPDPQGKHLGAGAVVSAVLSAPFLMLALFARSWWLLIPALLIVVYAADILYGLLLLASAWWRWRGTAVQGILVLSDSPNWKEYIEEHWLPRMEDRMIVLNWSKRRDWPGSLPVRIFCHFGRGVDNFNHNPLVILFRGLRFPLVYRFLYAFRDAKHDRPEALRRLEEHMFAELNRT